jgi:hypothetical protein
MKNLLDRNHELNEKNEALKLLHLPFILIHTSEQNIIQCEMSDDKMTAFFNLR